MTRVVKVSTIFKYNEDIKDIDQRVWEVPDDFSKEEESLLIEICVNGQLSYSNAISCVRNLRK